LTWDDLDGSKAADALPGDDFTAMPFIIQQYFAAPRPWAQTLPERRIAPLGKEFLGMGAVRP
jgi:hypothetical protein